MKRGKKLETEKHGAAQDETIPHTQQSSHNIPRAHYAYTPTTANKSITHNEFLLFYVKKDFSISSSSRLLFHCVFHPIVSRKSFK